MHRNEVVKLAWRTLVAAAFATCALLLCLGGQMAEAARLDPSFGKGGTAIVKTGKPIEGSFPSSRYRSFAWVLRQDHEGRYVIGGGVGRWFAIVKRLSDGRPDPGFGEGGLWLHDSGVGYPDDAQTWGRVRGLLIRPGGAYVFAHVTGLTGQGVRQTRMEYFTLVGDGAFGPPSWDPSLGDPGWTGPPTRLISTQLDPRWAVSHPTGWLVAGMSTEDDVVGSRSRGFAMRLQYDGSPSAGLGSREGSTAYYGPDWWPRGTEFEQIKRHWRGRYLVVGTSRRRIFVGRLTEKGDWDTSFGRSNRGYLNFSTKVAGGKPCYCEAGTGFAVDGRRRVLVVGYAHPPRRPLQQPRRLRLLRLLPDGRLDRAFGRKGLVASVQGQRLEVRRVVVDGRGRVYVSAGLGKGDGPTRFAVFAFRSDGKPDRSFFGNGRYIRGIGEQSIAEDMLIDREGRLVVSGSANIGGDAAYILKRFVLDR